MKDDGNIGFEDFLEIAVRPRTCEMKEVGVWAPCSGLQLRCFFFISVVPIFTVLTFVVLRFGILRFSYTADDEDGAGPQS